MGLADPLDSATACGFKVRIDGIEIPKVMEVSGLKMEVDKITHNQQTADGKFVPRQVPGRKKSGEFVVTRGLTDSKTISDWIDTVMKGDVAGARKTAAVIITDYQGNDLKTYEFTNCWVRQIEGSNPKAGSTEPMSEKFTVCYDESTVK